jgi:hypothetical protein
VRRLTFDIRELVQICSSEVFYNGHREVQGLETSSVLNRLEVHIEQKMDQLIGLY